MNMKFALSLIQCITLSSLLHAPMCALPALQSSFEVTRGEGYSAGFSLDRGMIQWRVENLRATLKRMTELACYQPHGTWLYCNVAARDCMDDRSHPGHEGYGFMLGALHLDLSALYPDYWSIMHTPIREAYRRALIAVKLGRIERVSMRHGWELAQQGECVYVISERYNHECILYPDARCVRIAQCGLCCGVFDIRHPAAFWMHYNDPEIMFLWIKRKSE
jgi:hypothetical protein